MQKRTSYSSILRPTISGKCLRELDCFVIGSYCRATVLQTCRVIVFFRRLVRSQRAVQLFTPSSKYISIYVGTFRQIGAQAATVVQPAASASSSNDPDNLLRLCYFNGFLRHVVAAFLRSYFIYHTFEVAKFASQAVKRITLSLVNNQLLSTTVKIVTRLINSTDSSTTCSRMFLLINYITLYLHYVEATPA